MCFLPHHHAVAMLKKLQVLAMAGLHLLLLLQVYKRKEHFKMARFTTKIEVKPFDLMQGLE